MAPNLSRNRAFRKMQFGMVLVFSLAGFVAGASYLLKLIPMFNDGNSGQPAIFGQLGENIAQFAGYSHRQNGELMQIDPKYWTVFPAAYRVPRPPGDLNYGRVCLPEMQIDQTGQCVQSGTLKQMAHTQGRQSPTASPLKRAVQTIRSLLSGIVNQLNWIASHMGRFPVFVRVTPLMVRMVR